MCSLELALVTKNDGGRSKVSFLYIRRDFETIQRGIFSTLAPLLRKHLTDPECNTTELFFLLHAGLVVGGLLRGRVLPAPLRHEITVVAGPYQPLLRSRFETAMATEMAVMVV